MNINNISAAVNFYGGYGQKKSIPQKPEDTFADELEKAMKEQDEIKAEKKIIEFSEAGTGRITTEGSYEITDGQAEYFREKFGEKYDGDRAVELYYQLADNGIISEADAGEATFSGGIMIFDDPTVMRGGYHGDMFDPRLFSGTLNLHTRERHIVESVVFTDPDSPYCGLWDEFEKEYDGEIVTWQDELQKKIDFNYWWLDRCDGLSDFARQRIQSAIDGLEKTRNVIGKIFN